MSGAAVQISRGALMAMSAGAGSMYLYVNGALPAGLSSKDMAVVAAQLSKTGALPSPNGGTPGGEELPAYLKPLADQLGELSGEVARMRVQTQYGHGFAYSNSGWGVSWTTMATAGGVGVLVLYMKGYSFADFMYVTKKALALAVEALEEGIENIGVALEATKRELSYKMGLIEDKVDETRDALENKISSEVGDVKRDLEVVGNDVKGISRAQDQVHGMVASIETQIDSIEGRMTSANEQLSTANRGIYLLCNVVADNMRGGPAKGSSGFGSRGRGASLYDELVAYTRSAMGSFRGSASGPSVPEEQQQPALTDTAAGHFAVPRQHSTALDAVPGIADILNTGSFRLSNNNNNNNGNSAATNAPLPAPDAAAGEQQ